MLSQVLRVAGELVVRVRHQDHVPALLDRHVLVVAFDVAGRVGKVRAEVVHRIPVRVEAALLIFEKRIQVVPEQLRIGVQEERHGRVHDVDGVDVAVGRNLLLEHQRLGSVGARVGASPRGWDS